MNIPRHAVLSSLHIWPHTIARQDVDNHRDTGASFVYIPRSVIWNILGRAVNAQVNRLQLRFCVTWGCWWTELKPCRKSQFGSFIISHLSVVAVLWWLLPCCIWVCSYNWTVYGDVDRSKWRSFEHPLLFVLPLYHLVSVDRFPLLDKCLPVLISCLMS